MVNWKRFLLGILLIGLAFSGLTAWSAALHYQHMLHEISIQPQEQVQPQPKRSPPAKDQIAPKQPPLKRKIDIYQRNYTQPEPQLLLLYGLDKREHNWGKGRPDTIMLAFVHPEKELIKLVSIPRDAYVSIPGHGHHKLNQSFSKGDVHLTIKTLENWLGLKPSGHIAIDFGGFEKMIDLLGGIEIHVERRMTYTDPKEGLVINLKQGQQVLNGEQALQYVRFRHSNDGQTDSDYKRMERQQEVLKLMGQKAKSLPVLIKILAVKRIMEEHIQTSLTPDEINEMIKWFIKLEIKIDNTSLVGEGRYMQGQWFEIIPDLEINRIKTFINESVEMN